MSGVESAVLTDFPGAPEVLEVSEGLLLGNRQVYTDSFMGTVLQYDILLGAERAGDVELYSRRADRTRLAYHRVDNPRFAHQGIVTKAVRCLCRFAFEEQGITEIQASIHDKNTPSRKVVERLGAQAPRLGFGYCLWILHEGDLR